jgi:hypothetical protein
MITGWLNDYGFFPVGPEWADVRIRKDGWPDRRYRRSRDMIAHFQALRP